MHPSSSRHHGIAELELPEGWNAAGVRKPISIDEKQNQTRSRADLEAEVELYRGILDRVIDITSEAAEGNLEARLLHCDGSEKLRKVARSITQLLGLTDGFLRPARAPPGNG